VAIKKNNKTLKGKGEHSRKKGFGRVQVVSLEKGQKKTHPPSHQQRKKRGDRRKEKVWFSRKKQANFLTQKKKERELQSSDGAEKKKAKTGQKGRSVSSEGRGKRGGTNLFERG